MVLGAPAAPRRARRPADHRQRRGTGGALRRVEDRRFQPERRLLADTGAPTPLAAARGVQGPRFVIVGVFASVMRERPEWKAARVVVSESKRQSVPAPSALVFSN